jgi:mRNA-degrading endonuclease RelE of RelBE toxin-antitoxin system
MYRYRIGDLRMFYVIHEREIMVAVIEIAKRKDAY